MSKIKNIGRRDKQEFYNFMGELGKYKQKKINQWRKQFLDDNLKY